MDSLPVMLQWLSECSAAAFMLLYTANPGHPSTAQNQKTVAGQVCLEGRVQQDDH